MVVGKFTIMRPLTLLWSTCVCVTEAPTTITIVHFNDVYDIEAGSQEPVGGAARFATAVRRLADRDPLVLFCGDALNPSVMSRVTQGRQMISVLNAIGVHCAMYGNHDFDHGVDNLVDVSVGIERFHIGVVSR